MRASDTAMPLCRLMLARACAQRDALCRRARVRGACVRVDTAIHHLRACAVAIDITLDIFRRYATI